MPSAASSPKSCGPQTPTTAPTTSRDTPTHLPQSPSAPSERPLPGLASPHPPPHTANAALPPMPSKQTARSAATTAKNAAISAGTAPTGLMYIVAVVVKILLPYKSLLIWTAPLHYALYLPSVLKYISSLKYADSLSLIRHKSEICRFPFEARLEPFLFVNASIMMLYISHSLSTPIPRS